MPNISLIVITLVSNAPNICEVLYAIAFFYLVRALLKDVASA